MTTSPPAPNPDGTGQTPDALQAMVAEVESFVHTSGWDTPRQMFALVRTDELLAHEPGLVGKIAPDAVPTEYTPVEQGAVPGDTVADALAKIAWPDEVAGCVLVLEIMVDDAPRQSIAEGRMAVGVLRGAPGGACALRWRHAPDGPVTYSPDLAPELITALHATFEA